MTKKRSLIIWLNECCTDGARFVSISASPNIDPFETAAHKDTRSQGQRELSTSRLHLLYIDSRVFVFVTNVFTFKKFTCKLQPDSPRRNRGDGHRQNSRRDNQQTRRQNR